MVRARRLTAAERQKLVAEHRKGVGTKALSERFKITERAVRYAVAAEDQRKIKVPGKDATIAVRLDHEAVRSFDATLSRHNFVSRSEALRRIIDAASGYFAPDDYLAEQVQRMNVELSRLGTNINQIARRLNEARLIGSHGSISKSEVAEIRGVAVVVADLREDLNAVIRRRQLQLADITSAALDAEDRPDE